MKRMASLAFLVLALSRPSWAAEDPSTPEGSGGQSFPKPYSPPCTERENVFAFTEKPAVKDLGNDKYEITFAVKGHCDVTVGIMDEQGVVVRHLASGVLGANAPAPFQKNALKQTLYWNGKDDLYAYVKEPGKLKVRVRLGLRPEFDKLLGGTSPKNLPGFIWGLAADAEGVYVFCGGTGSGHLTLRKFDHDGNYVKTLYPPAADLPPEKLAGMGYVEYESGKRALQAPYIHHGIFRSGQWLPPGVDTDFGTQACRPAAAGGRLFVLAGGFSAPGSSALHHPTRLHFLPTDGSTTWQGLRGREWATAGVETSWPRLAASPDGRRLYLAGWAGSWDLWKSKPAVLSGSTDGEEKATVFAGDPQNPGSDERHFNNPTDVACDAAGRVYVADSLNGRIQVFSPDGRFLKTLALDRPRLVQVHLKTGAIYAAHAGRVQGQTVGRISKFRAFPDLTLERGWDNVATDVMTLDSWTDKPRLWLTLESVGREGGTFIGTGLVVMEEDSGQLRKIVDFGETAREEAGESYLGRWQSGVATKVTCDPARETLYFNLGPIFDLPSGKLLGRWDPANQRGVSFTEVQFDRHGYMHCHAAAHFDNHDGVARLDSRQALWRQGLVSYPETPYDYGEERAGRWNHQWVGVLPLYRTDPQLYTWGLGVNMFGDLAVSQHVAYAPKLDTEAEMNAGYIARAATGKWAGPNRYAETMKQLQDQELKGEKIYSIRRRPGIPLNGATIWTFNRNGELREDCAVVAGSRNNGVQMDEDGFLYFTNARFRLLDGKPFLSGRGGNYGGTLLHPDNRLPFTGTYLKTRGKDVLFLSKSAPVPPQEEDIPQRPPDLIHPNVVGGGAPMAGTEAWVTGAEWLYAGASPIVAYHCDCPQMRVHLDWYKRSFVPEAYRHSIGVLDTAGNLILHIGQYGNFDGDFGPRSTVPPKGDGIATTHIRYLSGTDNYLCFSDWALRLIVLKLNCHAEETVGIGP